MIISSSRSSWLKHTEYINIPASRLIKNEAFSLPFSWNCLSENENMPRRKSKGFFVLFCFYTGECQQMKFSVSEKITALQPQEIIGSEGSITLRKSGWGQNRMTTWDMTSHPLGWRWSKADNGGEVRRLSGCCRTVGWGSPCGKLSGSSPNDCMQSSLRPSNSAPWYIPKRTENLWHTKTCAQMFTALFIKAKKGEGVNIRRWMDKYPCRGIVFSHKKAWSTDSCYSMDGHWKRDAEWGSQTQGFTNCMILLIWNVQNPQRQKDE